MIVTASTTARVSLPMGAAIARLQTQGWTLEPTAPAFGARRLTRSRRHPRGPERTSFQVDLAPDGAGTRVTARASAGSPDREGPQAAYRLQRSLNWELDRVVASLRNGPAAPDRTVYLGD